MRIKLNKNKIFIPKGLLVDSNDKNALNLRQWLINELVGLGALTKDPCCDCECSYDVSAITVPTTLESIDIDGTTIEIADAEIEDVSQIVAIINTLGLGAFTYDQVNGIICAPKNAHTYGDIVTADDTLTNSCS